MVVLSELINSFFKVEGSITIHLLQCGNHQLLREINNFNDKNETVQKKLWELYTRLMGI